jgi:hypothetical protein
VDAAVVVHPDELVAPREPGDAAPDAALAGEGPVEVSRRDRLEQRAVVEAVALAREAPVEGVRAPVGRELEHVVRHADAAAGSALAQHGGRLRVREQEVLEGARGGREALPARRDRAAEVAAEEEHDRLVQRHPQPDAGAERAHDLLRVAAEAGDALRRLPAAGGVEPARVRVVVQRHAGLDPEAAQGRDPLDLELERVVREAARLRLDAAALEREAVGVGGQRRQQREVGGPALAVAGAGAAALRADLQPAGGLPLRPVVVRRALDLVRGGGDAPQEAGKGHPGSRFPSF